MTVVGTRPEIIRLSCTLARLDTTFQHTLVHTDQNYDYELGPVFFEELSLRQPDRHLKVDTSSLGHVLAGTLIGVENAILEVRPHAFLVLGDTNSSIAAVIAKRLQIPVYHMEAGNRSFDPNVPEETNRRLVDHVADFNLVYTEHARRNLIAEGVPSRRIALTGSPMMEVLTRYRPAIERSPILDQLGLTRHHYILVSVHREENVDEPERLTRTITMLVQVQRHFQRTVLVSTHPRTQSRLRDLGQTDDGGIVFHKPFGFLDYAQLQRNAFCVLSDSGTISEESSILGFPAVTLREAIERPEALDTGAIVTTGLDGTVVMEAVQQVVDQWSDGEAPPVPVDYQVPNCSQRVVNFIRSTAHVHHAWAGIRRRSQVWNEAKGPPGP